MKRKKVNPVFAFILLTIIVMLLSFVLSLFGLQSEYSTVNSYTYSLQNNVVQVENLLSAEGVKYIITTTVDNFVNFAPLGNLIIILIGIGVLERSGFARVFFTLITQSFRKNSITFILILLSLLSSLFGEVGFVVFLPIGAMLFKYGHRNPLGGIVASFAGICFGYGMNAILSSNLNDLVSLTTLASHVVDSSYSIGYYFQLFIMLVAIVISSILMTRITEKVVMPKLGKYEFDEIEMLDNVKFSNRELRGLIIGLGAGIIYSLVILYMIIPGLPLSGGLLDSSATRYIDKLFGEYSLFNQGFIFIITFLFVIIGFGYGIVSKSINDSKDITDSLSYCLDRIGSVLVLLFFASLFISVLDKSNIALVVVASLTKFISLFKFSGLGLVILLLVISILCGLFNTELLTKWNIMSGTVVPTLMKSSVSPEFSQVVFTVGSSISMGFTPVMPYFVIYIALLSLFDKSNKVTISSGINYLFSYVTVILVMWIILMVGFYIIGLPIGIGSTPIVSI